MLASRPVFPHRSNFFECSVVEYRTFRNSDPPAVLRLWHDAGLGRGAALSITNEAFDLTNYSQPYFDREGVIFATDTIDGEERVVGMVHAGFGFTAGGTSLDHKVGVIAAILVDPNYRRQGIATELLNRAEAYLRDRGAERLLAGSARGHDAFYFGIYGGARPSGFLESDPAAQHFFESKGYAVKSTHGVYQRDLSQGRDPTNFQIVSIRRKTELDILDSPVDATWWWFTHIGRFDSVSFRLVPRVRGEPFASVTVMGMDVYLPRWQERVVGLTDLWVREDVRGNGYGQTLIIEVLRRLRQELVTRAEIHCPDEMESPRTVINACKFDRVDTGRVYEKTTAAE